MKARDVSGELGGTADGSKPLPQIWGGGFFIYGAEFFHEKTRDVAGH